MTEVKSLVLGNSPEDQEKTENPAENAKFQEMVETFHYFTEKSADPFGPCGFLHRLLETAISRAYEQAYQAIGSSQNPDAFINTALHMKKCLELSREMTGEISAAMGEMHKGGSYSVDMMKAVGQLMRLLNE